ncbi:4Fe-4S dicluster domain-containing protein [bacterium]|nr:4Fe-4S dicluster domain-containing protein [bacterium]
MRKLVINPKLCTNCHICELACSFKQSQQLSLFKTCINTVHLAQDNITIPITCLHCVEAACVSACPAKAISKNESTGAIEIDYELCIGCRTCMGACPFGNVLFDANSSKTGVYKCNLCKGDPMCAKFCPTQAILYC